MTGKDLKQIWEEEQLTTQVMTVFEIHWGAIFDGLFGKEWRNRSMDDTIKLVHDDTVLPAKVLAVLRQMGHPKAA